MTKIRLFCFLTLLLVMPFMASAAASRTPDFRFPKSVAKTAEADLRRALREGDGEATVDALVRYSLAWSSISEEHLSDITSRIEEVANREQTSVDVRALLLHLEARVIEAFPNRWSHLELEARIDSLYEASLRDLPQLSQYPLTRYPKVIDFGPSSDTQEVREAQRLLPTLAEFLLFHTRRAGHLHPADPRIQLLQPVIEKEQADSVEQARVHRERQRVWVQALDVMGSRDSLRLKIDYRNVSRLHLEVLTPKGDTLRKDAWQFRRKELQSLRTYDLSLPAGQPDTDLHYVAVLPPLPYGCYFLDYSFVSRSGECQQRDRFYRSDLTRVTDTEEVLVRLSERDSAASDAYTLKKLYLDRSSGRPLERLNPSDRYFEHHDATAGQNRSRDTLFSLQVLTDRGLYRPGETVNYSAILQASRADQRSLLAGRTLCISLLNSEHTSLMQDTLLTDAFGQATGRFLLPQGERNGAFYLDVKALGGELCYAQGGQYVQVDAYKVPTFSIDFAGTPARVSEKDSLLVQGQVMSFSGVPVAHRELQLTLTRSGWWWRSSGGEQVETCTLTTDGEGRFSACFDPSSLLNGHSSWFTLEAHCTNAGGETQQAQHRLFIEREREGEEAEQPSPLGDKAESDTLTHPSQLTPAMIPAGSSLWIHPMYASQRAEGVAQVRIGTSVPDAWVYYVVDDQRGMLTQGWLHYAEPGLHDFTYPMPQPAAMGEEPHEAKLTIHFLSMRQGKVTTAECNFRPAVDPDTIRLTLTTFRDRLVPGVPESWTFRVEGRRLNLTRQRSRLLLSIYDHALDQLYPYGWSYWSSPLPAYGVQSGFWHSSDPDYCSFVQLSYAEPAHLLMPSWPWLNLYGESFFEVRTRARGGLLYAKNAMVMESNELQEEAVMDYGVSRKMARVAPTSALASAAPDGLQLMDATAEEAGEEAVDAAAAAHSLAGLSLRAGQQRLALWAPQLTTDSLGVLSLTFQVPDQNTTWRMQALALSPWGSIAQLDTTLLAQRPLMVQPSLPRFLRQGDRLTLSALVLNATDSLQQVTALVELYDPRTRREVAQHACLLTLAAGGQRAAEVALVVPDTLEQLAFRVRAKVEGGRYAGFGDGEQLLLPVLPAVTPVVESLPFYFDPGMAPDTIALPDTLPAGAQVEVERFDDPVAFCLQSLPDLMEGACHTSTSLSHRLYALGVSQLLEPLDAAVRADSLPSPRYPAALADSLFAQLKRLQNPDGGLSWTDCPDRRSSLYATAEVLQLMGELHQLNPAFLTPYLHWFETPLHYYDSLMVCHYRELPRRLRRQLDVNYFTHYLYICSLYPWVSMSQGVRKLRDDALGQCSRRWGELNLSGRAYMALALHRQGKRQESLARTLIESLRQHALTHPRRGMYWDQLEYSGYRWLVSVSQTSLLLRAFAAIDPRTEELDQIRKWLLLAKQSTHWGNSSLAADALQALLSTGSDWQQGQPHPTWGAVYVRYAAPVREAQAASNAELALYKEVLDAEGRVLSPDALAADSTLLRVGDRLTVRLRLVAERDMSEVMVTDQRAACLEPADPLSGHRWGGELSYYQEQLDHSSLFLIPRLPRGEHWLTYDLYVTSSGQFALGLAQVQCQYAPMYNAHTEGRVIRVGRK